jgi:hypothetical protein
MNMIKEIEDAAKFVAEFGGDLEKIAKEIAAMFPGHSWSYIRLSLEYQVDEMEAK